MNRPCQLGIVVVLVNLALCPILTPTFATGAWWPYGEQRKNSNEPAKLDTSPLPVELKQRTSFAEVIRRVEPGVVSIFTTKLSDASEHPYYNHPLFREHFENGHSPSTREEGLGSGVIVTADGYIITNNHVVEDADEIKVALINPRREFDARIIGTDPGTDIAVLKIEAENLPAVVLADSDRVEVGDMVMAIGNAFGVGQTVTRGIVSATGRSSIGLVKYEDFIQTDASINPGNSGGALIDPMGRLVGIPSAIISRTGGSQGIGFAIPTNLAMHIVERLLADGRVVRGFLGVQIGDLTSQLQEAFDMDNLNGALVNQVLPDSAASEAGIEHGDVIVNFNDVAIRNSGHLVLVVARTSPATVSKVTVFRNGEAIDIDVKLKERPDRDITNMPPPVSESETELLRGITLDDLNAQTRQRFNVTPDIEGAVVVGIEADSPAMDSGLRLGDVVLEINKMEVRNADDAIATSDELEEVDNVLVYVWRQGNRLFIMIEEEPDDE